MTEAINNQTTALSARYNLAESAEWRKLLRHFDLAAEGFNFIVLLIPDADGAAVCRQALADYLGQSGKTLLNIPLETPEDLQPLAGKLLDLKLPESTGAVWVAASAYQSMSEEEKWKAAWREGMARLNQFRNPLRNHINATLIFAGAPWLQEALREMAPDLWSVRTLVVSIQPPQATETLTDLPQHDLGDGGSTSDPELALREAEKLRGQPGKELTLARILHRAGTGLMERHQWREAAALFEESLQLKRHFDDGAESTGQTLINFGRCLNVLGRNGAAIDVLKEALALLGKAGVRQLEGAAFCYLGNVNLELGNIKEAIADFEHTLVIARQTNDKQGEGPALSGLGNAYAALGDPHRAIKFFEKCLMLLREIDNRRGEGIVLGNLGIAYKNLGEPHRAIEFYEQSIAIGHEIGDRLIEGNALGNLGNAYLDLGDRHRAIEFFQQDLAICREIGNRRGEGNVLSNLGNAYADLGEPRRAIEFYKQALIIAREIGDLQGEGNALGNLGAAYKDLGELHRAIEFYEQYLAIARRIGDRRGEGNALDNLGNAYTDLGELRRAVEFYEQRLIIARETSDRRGEGTSLWNMALALGKLGERARAIACAETALKIYGEIESPYTEMIHQQLAQWRRQR